LSYLPTIRKAASSIRADSDVISHILEELDARAAVQDRRVADIQVRLDVLEDRWLRSGWISTNYPSRQVPVSNQGESGASVIQRDQVIRRPEPGIAAMERIVRSSARVTRPSKSELLVLGNLQSGQLTAPEVKTILGSSREHAARVMKALTDKGLVVRDLTKRPYTYELSESGRDYVTSTS